MNRIVFNLGLLIFFLAIIFFSQREMPVLEVLIRSFTVFVFLTSMLAIMGIVLIRAINKKALTKKTDLSDNLTGE